MLISDDDDIISPFNAGYLDICMSILMQDLCLDQEAEKLTLENAKLAEENKDLHKTVEALQKKNQEVEASLEEKTNYLLRLAEEVASREEKILTNEQLLSNANQKVCVLLTTMCVCQCVSAVQCVCVCVWELLE